MEKAKRFSKTSLTVLGIITVLVLLGYLSTLAAGKLQSWGAPAVAIAFFVTMLAGSSVGLFTSALMAANNMNDLRLENAQLQSQVYTLNSRISRLKLREVTYTKEFEAREDKMMKELEAARYKALTAKKHMEEVRDQALRDSHYLYDIKKLNTDLIREKIRLQNKLDAEVAAHRELAASSGKKMLHSDARISRTVEHPQKARAQKKMLQTKLEVSEDELGMLRLMSEDYWRMKRTYEPRIPEGISTNIDGAKLLSSAEILKEAV